MKRSPRRGRSEAALDQIVIRSARPADQPELIGLVRAYYRFDHISYDRRILPVALARLLRTRTLGRVWIAHGGTKPVGYVVLTFNYDLEFGGIEGLVTDLFVVERYRGAGLGRRLLDTVDDYCRAHDIGAIELQVESANIEAQAFYGRIGFKQLSRMVMLREVSDRRQRARVARVDAAGSRRSLRG